MVLEFNLHNIVDVDGRTIVLGDAHIGNQDGQQFLLLIRIAIIAGLIGKGGIRQGIVVFRAGNLLVVHVKVDREVCVVRESTFFNGSGASFNIDGSFSVAFNAPKCACLNRTNALVEVDGNRLSIIVQRANVGNGTHLGIVIHGQGIDPVPVIPGDGIVGFCLQNNVNVCPAAAEAAEFISVLGKCGELGELNRIEVIDTRYSAQQGQFACCVLEGIARPAVGARSGANRNRTAVDGQIQILGIKEGFSANVKCTGSVGYNGSAIGLHERRGTDCGVRTVEGDGDIAGIGERAVAIIVIIVYAAHINIAHHGHIQTGQALERAFLNGNDVIRLVLPGQRRGNGEGRLGIAFFVFVQAGDDQIVAIFFIGQRIVMNLFIAERYIIKDNAQVGILREGIPFFKFRIRHIIVDTNHRTLSAMEITKSTVGNFINALSKSHGHGCASIAEVLESIA